jgi:hypothetical protein
MSDTKAKHTPGPWEVQGSLETWKRTVVGQDAFPVAEVTKRRFTTDANARLIAAAPELAAALLATARHPGPCWCRIEPAIGEHSEARCLNARDALRKAGLLP